MVHGAPESAGTSTREDGQREEDVGEDDGRVKVFGYGGSTWLAQMKIKLMVLIGGAGQWSAGCQFVFGE